VRTANIQKVLPMPHRWMNVKNVAETTMLVPHMAQLAVAIPAERTLKGKISAHQHIWHSAQTDGEKSYVDQYRNEYNY
jgi:hypothetical protein